MESGNSSRATRASKSRGGTSDTTRRGRARATSKTSTPTVSVMEAVSNLKYSPSAHHVGNESSDCSGKARSGGRYTSDSHSQSSVMATLGLEPQHTSSRSRSKDRKDRDRSSSRTRTTVEEKKKSIREARARSRSRSTTRPTTRSESNPRSTSANRASASSALAEKTKTTVTSRRSNDHNNQKMTPSSGSGGNKKTSSTQQLILFRHAARCSYGNPQSTDKLTRCPCPIHKQCAETKALLQHMSSCDCDESCPFPHCTADAKILLELIYPGGTTQTTTTTATTTINTSSHRESSNKKQAANNNNKKDTTSTQRTERVPLTAQEQRETARHIDELMEAAEESHNLATMKQKSKKKNETRRKYEDPLAKTEDMSSHIKSIAEKIKDPSMTGTTFPEVFSFPFGGRHKKDSKSAKAASSAAPAEQEDGDIELGEAIEDAEDTLEQQSLLEEIHARRLSRAPKSQHNKKKSMQGHPSTTTTAAAAREIKLKAESIMAKISPSNDNGENSSFFSFSERQGKWARIGKFVCIASAFMIIFSMISLILLYIFGGDEWKTFAGQEVEADNQDAGMVEFVPTDNLYPTPAPVSLTVESDAHGMNTPTMSPTSFITSLPVYTVEVLNGDGIHSDDVGGQEGDVDAALASPQTMAFRWTLSEQEYMEETLQTMGISKAEAIKQEEWFTDDQYRNRFALATLYFSTTASKSKTEPTGETIKNTSNWTHSYNWLSFGVSECEWSFYGCDRGDSLWIPDNGLRGTLPPEIGMLTSIRDLAIMNNQYLTGPIPSQASLLQSTVSLNLQGNNLSGAIPSEIALMKKLRWLYLDNNNLESTIPAEIGHLARLAYLWLNNNKFTGSLNPSLFTHTGFKYLQELLFHGNQLTGTIPNEIGNLPRIRFVSLHSNLLTGSIPTTLGALTGLEVLQLHDNPYLTGSVPEELCLLLQRGSLRTLTIDCIAVSCDCGCSCANDEDDLPPMKMTHSPTTVATPAPTASPTNISSAVAETDTPTSIVSTAVPTTTPSAMESPDSLFAPSIALVTAVPTAAPSAMESSGSPTLPPSPSPTQTATTIPDKTDDATAEAYREEDATIPPDRGPEGQAFGVVTVSADFMLQLPEFTKEALLDPWSPQSAALEWLQADPNLAQYSFARNLQRFALVTFFFSTSGAQWTNQVDWLDYSAHECDWFTSYNNPSGSICIEDPDDGELRITELMQWGNNLDGPLPAEISLLTSLQSIFLGMNNVTSIPTEIGLLTNSLAVLNLMHCTLEQTIPTELGELSHLKKLDLSENFLDGTLPTELGRLKLENLYVNHNYLAGHISEELFDLTHVQGLNLAANAFSGTIPSEIGKLSHVQWMNLYGNWIEGRVPTEFGHLHKMVALHTSYNLLTGPIPSELGQLTSSHSLSIDFRYNELTGSIPSELGALTNLVILALEGNSHLTGEMPREVCLLASDWKLTTLSLDCSAVQCGTVDECSSSGTEEGEICLCESDEEEGDDDEDGGGGGGDGDN